MKGSFSVSLLIAFYIFLIGDILVLEYFFSQHAHKQNKATPTEKITKEKKSLDDKLSTVKLKHHRYINFRKFTFF